MNDRERVMDSIRKSPDGIVTTAQITKEGIHRGVLQELVKSGELTQYGRGLYADAGRWEDEMRLLQLKYARGVFSHETALFLHGYSDRTPAKFIMTFPKGYNAPSLKQENVTVRRVVKENYDLGIVSVKSPCGGEIYAYNLERSLCDVLRGNGGDVQVINAAMKKYAASKEKDMHRLMEYARQLRVLPKVLHYMEVLL